ncbi:MAG: ATP-binding protein [Elusimicrobiota bacterium]
MPQNPQSCGLLGLVNFLLVAYICHEVYILRHPGAGWTDDVGLVAFLLAVLFVVLLTFSARDRRFAATAMSKRVLDGIFAGMRDALIVFHPDGTIRKVNEAAMKLLGYSELELVGRPARDLFPQGDGADKVGRLDEWIRAGAPGERELYVLTKAGERVPVEFSASPLRDERGRMAGIIGVARDISERKAAEVRETVLQEQLLHAEKLNTLGQSLSGIAHEINNPLTGIMTFCQLLLQEDAIQGDARHREDVETILREAERCKKIVKNVTTFARKHKPEKTFVGLNGILQDCLRLQSRLFRNRHIRVRTELAGDVPKTMADFHQLQQVFFILINNALDVLEDRPGEGAVTIRTRREGENIRVEFEDDGPGIPADNLQKIFEPFFTTKEVGRGTGLGLPIAYGIIAEHGGRIWAESRRQGALFVFEIPVTEDASRAAGEAPAAEPPLPSGWRVLVVDDEDSILTGILRLLRQMNMRPDVARDGKAALEKLQQGDYDAVFCDLRLPGCDGMVLYRWMKENKPELVPRWVFITGSASDEARSFFEGPDLACLQKPFGAKEIRETLSRLAGPGPRGGGAMHEGHA